MTSFTNAGDFIATEDELEIVARIYEHVGGSSSDHIKTETLARIFANSAELTLEEIDEIWSFADVERRGYLSDTSVAIALRLLGWIQAGEAITSELINSPGPLPEIKLTSSNPQPTDTSDLPAFTEHERVAYQKIFEDSGPKYGLLEGDKARHAFMMFDLSKKDIWKIWEISDTRKRGALDRHDFALAMYVIEGVHCGRLACIPSTTPVQIYEQIFALWASQSPKSPTFSKPPNSPKFPKTPKEPISPKSPKTPKLPSDNGYTVTNNSTSVTSSSAPKASPRSEKALPQKPAQLFISYEEMVTAEKYFESLDEQKLGYIKGDVVAQFMMGFNLVPEDLALIWDLADLTHDDRLDCKEFTIAMYLIQQRLKGAELPTSLPSTLISSVRTLHPDIPSKHTNPAASSPKRHRAKSYIDVPPVLHNYSIPPSPSLSNRHSMIAPTTFHSNNPVPTSAKSPDSKFRNSEIEQIRSLERENSLLHSQIEDLKSRIMAESDVRAANDSLTRENQSLIVQMLEMEHITSEVLHANETNPMVEDLKKENRQLALEVADLNQVKVQLEETTRKLDSSLRENKDLSVHLRSAREAAEAESRRSAEEMDHLKRTVDELNFDNTDLRRRTQEMERMISRTQAPRATTNAEELEILLGDVTRENEDLKERMRQMQASTASLLLSTGSVVADDLRNENQRLSTHVEELEQFVRQLQHSSDDNELQRVLQDVTGENDSLKRSLRELREQVHQLQVSSSSRTVEPLQQEISQLKDKIAHLQIQLHDASSHTLQDISHPPPAYDEFQTSTLL